jgi:ShK domain-like
MPSKCADNDCLCSLRPVGQPLILPLPYQLSPNYMIAQCKKSCYVCGGHEYEGDGSDFGVPQKLGHTSFSVTEMDGKKRLSMAYRHIQNAEVPSNIKKKCINLHEQCTNWAVAGECDKNPVWMKKECAPSCRSCDFIHYLERCPMDVNNLGNIWEADDLDKMFEKRKLRNSFFWPRRLALGATLTR